MKTVILVIIGSFFAGAGFFVAAYILATIVDKRGRKRRMESHVGFAKEYVKLQEAKWEIQKKHSTIYDEMMDNPELAESLLVDKEPWPDSLRNTAKSTGARDQSTLDTATEFHRDPS